MATNPPGDIVNGFLTGLATGIADALWPLAFIMMSSAIAAPALGSLLVVWMSARWGLLRGSAIASVVAGAILTFFSFYTLAFLLNAFHTLQAVPREWVLVLPWLAGLLVLYSLYRHYLGRAGLDRPQLAGIASCYMLAIGAVLTDMLTR